MASWGGPRGSESGDSRAPLAISGLQPLFAPHGTPHGPASGSPPAPRPPTPRFPSPLAPLALPPAATGPLSGLAASIAQLPSLSVDFLVPVPAATAVVAWTPGPRARSSLATQAAHVPPLAPLPPPPVPFQSFSPPETPVLPPPLTYLVAPHPSGSARAAPHKPPGAPTGPPPPPAPRPSLRLDPVGECTWPQPLEHSSAADHEASSRTLGELHAYRAQLDAMESMRRGAHGPGALNLEYAPSLAARSLQLREELARFQEESLRVAASLGLAVGPTSRSGPPPPLAHMASSPAPPGPIPIALPPPSGYPRPQLGSPPEAGPAAALPYPPQSFVAGPPLLWLPPPRLPLPPLELAPPGPLAASGHGLCSSARRLSHENVHLLPP
eukprot:tig00021489_g21703.t1